MDTAQVWPSPPRPPHSAPAADSPMNPEQRSSSETVPGMLDPPHRRNNSWNEEFLRQVEQASAEDIEPPPFAGGVDLGRRSTQRRRGGIALGKVLEETESFARREFGEAGVPNYMDCSSGNHGETYGMDDWRRLSPHRGSVNYDYSSDTIGRGGGGGGRQLAAKRWRRRRREQGGVAAALLWPLRQLRDAYLSCMMGLDSAVDFTPVGGASGGASPYHHHRHHRPASSSISLSS